MIDYRPSLSVRSGNESKESIKMSSAPQSISGFPEYLPAQQLVFQSWLQTIAHSFEKYGCAPIETPAVERLTTLVSKGAAEHDIYTLSRYREQSRGSSEEFGLRFDLTVPLARYVAQHFDALVFPFKRYHIAPVWRGERPQKGRYRQFYQCDVDVLGHNTLSVSHDAEIIEILQSTLEALDVGPFTLQLNHKKLLIAILEVYAVSPEHIDTCLKVLDKRMKISMETFMLEMQPLSAQSSELIAVLDKISGPLHFALEALMAHELAKNESVQSALKDLNIIAQSLSTPMLSRIHLNLSLARGLAYYTGVIFETFLDQSPFLGSIASGGRYDYLSEQFSSRKTPGVGMSIGMSRLFHYKVLESEIVLKKATKARVLLTTQDLKCFAHYKALARALRAQGILLDHYLEDKALAHQIKYADKKGFEYIIMARSEEISAGQWILKSLETGLQQTYTQSSLIETLKNI